MHRLFFFQKKLGLTICLPLQVQVFFKNKTQSRGSNEMSQEGWPGLLDSAASGSFYYYFN
jgi:hypothetical protein